ncbi:hypothetical protein L226DRAFT_198288 [Lentinus tigrinus ALCF2SS1-7]|uniref:uncharacterized protein n=1 Tax=Lentinus tigrinus ALCF2SS1-7 TaxID=1328758 RepID=UPI001165D102|nr:hypothetical protein L226DRAFT_198288 [Lentinus tigrinus ALCF2SS1-7]
MNCGQRRRGGLRGRGLLTSIDLSVQEFRRPWWRRHPKPPPGASARQTTDAAMRLACGATVTAVTCLSHVRVVAVACYWYNPPRTLVVLPPDYLITKSTPQHLLCAHSLDRHRTNPRAAPRTLQDKTAIGCLRLVTSWHACVTGAFPLHARSTERSAREGQYTIVFPPPLD